jgi:anti-sigma factor RsiW
VIHPAPHLPEDRLFDCYLAGRSRESLDPRVAEHLADCDACAARYTELVGVMDQVRADAEAGTDAVFTPERLRAQQQHIERRLEHVGRAAKVISFPHHGAGERHDAPPHRLPRFVVAAAAAGLFIGVALGATYGQWRVWPAQSFSASGSLLARPSLGTPVATLETNVAPDLSADEAFWSELELMLDRPTTRELQPFDALTPRARDVSFR